MKVTSAYAHKMIKTLEEEKDYWTNHEQEASTYTSLLNETPLIPTYDYQEVSTKINAIDKQIRTIKHAINVVNTTGQLKVDEDLLCVDEILIEMAQLNQRKIILDQMRKQLPQTRITTSIGGRNAVSEYQYINYDQDLVKNDYDRISKRIMQLQMALDYHNQTYYFEV